MARIVMYLTISQVSQSNNNLPTRRRPASSQSITIACWRPTAFSVAPHVQPARGARLPLITSSRSWRHDIADDDLFATRATLVGSLIGRRALRPRCRGRGGSHPATPAPPSVRLGLRFVERCQLCAGPRGQMPEMSCLRQIACVRPVHYRARKVSAMT